MSTNLAHKIRKLWKVARQKFEAKKLDLRKLSILNVYIGNIVQWECISPLLGLFINFLQNIADPIKPTLPQKKTFEHDRK